MTPQYPSVGRIVHYVSYGTPGGEFPAGICRAAVVTAVQSTEEVTLAILNPTGIFFADTSIFYDEGKAPGTWHWPERV